MRALIVSGVVLVVLGIVVLIYQGIPYQTERDVIHFDTAAQLRAEFVKNEDSQAALVLFKKHRKCLLVSVLEPFNQAEGRSGGMHRPPTNKRLFLLLTATTCNQNQVSPAKQRAEL